MKQILHIPDTQKEMILTSMEVHRQGLKGTGKRVFDIAYNKILKMDHSLELDGMEMMYVSQALNSYGKKLVGSRLYDEAGTYRSMAMEMERIRINFQRTNGPKIKKEKTASAGTLTA
ncbi:hypothetical protein [Cytobacillus oceanisediminis]|uniref:hypothetical protein n=1 Tax=Cytobacillus oceanisediminis TaxID=665099 RepID=UPI001FB3DDB0|nr:hypothetical protein [Cytobacillus oceanisediminis]UOE54942.1 hypothetical protein IRB79_24730 [Cytobacillus oceanisediminis]